MTIACLDGYNLILPKGSGIATYGHGLLTALNNIGVDTQVLYGPATPRHADARLNEIALIDAKAPERQPASLGRAISTFCARWGRSTYSVPISGDLVWPEKGAKRPLASRYWSSTDIFNLANRAYRHYRTVVPVDFGHGPYAPDVMHWTCPLPLTAKRAVNLVTFHDIIPLMLPHSTADNKREYYDMCRDVLARADHILTVSERTKEDLVQILGADPNRITTTYQSATLGPPTETDEQAADHLGDQLGLDWRGYFLFYGAVEPKKNLGRIVEAFLDAKTSCPLVVVGGRAWLSEAETGLLDAVTAEGRNAKVLRLDYLPTATLRRLIRGARATLFPSLYEGFGLPVLESMLAGTPVMTSTQGALSEVAGDAAVMVDPYDVQGMSRAIRILDADVLLRDDLSRRGMMQAQKFSAEAYEARLRDVYKSLGLS